MDTIDVILYIKLKHRVDRDAHFLVEIQKLTSDLSRVHRIDAIYGKGYVGCVQSHMKAINVFISNPEWNTCLICEDDFTLRNSDIKCNNDILSELINQEKWDVLLLAHNMLEFLPTIKPAVVRVKSSQTASGYCLQKSFALTLLKNLQESYTQLIRSNNSSHSHTFANDQYWKKFNLKTIGLQQFHRWVFNANRFQI